MTDKELKKLVQEARAQYAREWRKKNPEKIKEYNRRYWERKAAEHAAAQSRK